MTSGTLEVQAVAQLCKALGEEARLRMVALLTQGELCVCHLEAALALPQSTVSRHLGVLRAAGVVTSRRAGGWVHYSLANQPDPLRRRLLKQLVRGYASDERLARDVSRLRRERGPGACS